MKYMLLMYADKSKAPHTPEGYQAVAQAWTNLRQEMITDGPFAETHEQLGGYYLLDCKDLDEAIRWAKKIPTAKYDLIEIRPLNRWSQEAQG